MISLLLQSTTHYGGIHLGFSAPSPSSHSRTKRRCCTCICKRTTHQHDDNGGSLTIDRRNVLLGLGGLCGVQLPPTNTSIGAPIEPPDLSKCRYVNPPCGEIDCCQPYRSEVVDFKFPSPSSPMRIRKAAHLLDQQSITNYDKAVSLMKKLPKTDPRNFYQQSNVHCAYCDGAYGQVGSNVELQIHNSWLFFPWHRFYIYFYEKILGKLLGDDTFALPFWNWDSPDGMRLPSIYVDPKSSLYDKLRDDKHQPPTTIDLAYHYVDPVIPVEELIKSNLSLMYRQVVSNGKTAELFMGHPYRAGDKPDPGAGSIECQPHNTVHLWTGDRTHHLYDMGQFYFAARDPIFFAHHCNVDRMWMIWRCMGGKDFSDRDWLDTSFKFYDENAQLVKVKVEDCLDPSKLRYGYQEVDEPWRRTRPTRKSKTKKKGVAKKGVAPKFGSKPGSIESTIESTIRVTVKRPKKLRTRKEKEEQEEVLVVDGIEIMKDSAVKFDVYINVEDESVTGPESSEYAGSFVNLPHMHMGKDEESRMKMKTNLRLGITDLLEDLEAEKDENVEVTLVPRIGKVTIGGLRIDFSS